MSNPEQAPRSLVYPSEWDDMTADEHMFVRADLPPDLAGLCFNCLSEEHVVGMCSNERVCLRCRQPGHIARECRAPPYPLSSAGGPCPVRERLGPHVGPSPSPFPPAPSPRAPAPTPQRATPVHAPLGTAALVAGRLPSECGGSAGGVARPLLRGLPVNARLGPSVPPTDRAPSERTLGMVPVVGDSSWRVRPGSPSARPEFERSVVPRSADISAAEDALRWSLVATAMGGMDDGIVGVQESSDMSISSDDDDIKQQNQSNMEIEHDHIEDQPDSLLGDPELGMTFDTENESQEAVYLDGIACSSTVQGSFDFGIATGNINPTPAAAIPYEGSSSMVMPPILGEYTSMMFQVQQASTVLSSPAELRFNGIGGLNNTTDQI
ncbi:hypothetical protein ZWY2020_028219 [Hordeum vulgare]|nr:hypothetical protein ZWY2020_028219 [Hordeum vulgare]